MLLGLLLILMFSCNIKLYPTIMTIFGMDPTPYCLEFDLIAVDVRFVRVDVLSCVLVLSVFST